MFEDPWFEEGPDLYDEVTEDPYAADPAPLTECPRCGGPLTVDTADPAVGIFGDMIFCENDLVPGQPCGWGEGDEVWTPMQEKA